MAREGYLSGKIHMNSFWVVVSDVIDENSQTPRTRDRKTALFFQTPT